MAAATIPTVTATSTPPEGAGVLQATRRRILVVDDDALVLGSLQRLLDTLDVDVEVCLDPEAALERLAHEDFDLVISDERMPKMTGTEVLRRVRASSPRTPTILLTAYRDARAVSAAYERSGVFCYLTKPWDNRDLVGTVREALRAGAAL